MPPTGSATTPRSLTDEGRARADARARAVDEADRRAALESAFASCVKRSGMPRAYRRPHWQAEAEAALDAFNSGAWLLWLSGDVGRGKSDYAASVLVAAARRRPFGRYLWRGDDQLMDSLRDSQGTSGLSGEMAVLAGAGLLVLDDLGKDSLTRWGLDKLWQLLNRRYEARLPTVVTSQLDLAGAASLWASVDERTAKALASRMRHRALHVALSGPDRRLADG